MTSPRRIACALPGDEHVVAHASARDVDDLADLLADAFLAYPWTDWVVPADGRKQRLRELHRLSLALVAMPYGSVFAALCPTAGRRPVGAVAVISPDQPVPDGAWGRLAAAQAGVLRERQEAASAAENAVADVRPRGPAVVVATLAVAPDHRRRGVAGRLLRPALHLADDLDVQTYLETSTQHNVDMYRSAGFEVVADRTVSNGGPEVWAMRRPSMSERAGP